MKELVGQKMVLNFKADGAEAFTGMSHNAEGRAIMVRGQREDEVVVTFKTDITMQNQEGFIQQRVMPIQVLCPIGQVVMVKEGDRKWLFKRTRVSIKTLTAFEEKFGPDAETDKYLHWEYLGSTFWSLDKCVRYQGEPTDFSDGEFDYEYIGLVEFDDGFELMH